LDGEKETGKKPKPLTVEQLLTVLWFRRKERGDKKRGGKKSRLKNEKGSEPNVGQGEKNR